MPELPEVETTARGIAPYVEGQKIQQIIVRQRQLRWPVPDDLSDMLFNLTFNSVTRRAKYLLFSTDKGTMLMHLGMSGSLRVLMQDKPLMKHDHIDFIFKNGTILRFNDPRRFGAVLWTADPPAQHVLIKDLGAEPLTTDFDGAYLYRQSKNRQTPVKSFIMDSHIVVGVGNIYANEALYMAGIDPSRHAGKISRERYLKLADCIKKVLESAIQQGGTTLRNFVNESGNPGYFKQQLLVYGRANMPCRQCLQPLTQIKISNRSTVFCKACQK